MATITSQAQPGSNRLVFAGSSADDFGSAKMFWQSLQLLPPFESRLVANDMGQRLKVAGPGPQTVNIVHKTPKQDSQKELFLNRAQAEESAVRFDRLQKLAVIREDTLTRLQQRRDERREKEQVRDGYIPSLASMASQPPSSSSGPGSNPRGTNTADDMLVSREDDF